MQVGGVQGDACIQRCHHALLRKCNRLIRLLFAGLTAPSRD
jgi:hypothetical protein